MAPRGKRGRPKKVEKTAAEASSKAEEAEVPTKKAKVASDGASNGNSGLKIVIEHWWVECSVLGL